MYTTNSSTRTESYAHVPYVQASTAIDPQVVDLEQPLGPKLDQRQGPTGGFVAHPGEEVHLHT